MSRRLTPWLLAVPFVIAGCIGRPWPPPPVPQRLVVVPGEYILAGTIRDQPYAARFTLTATEYALRHEDALCRGRNAALIERADSLSLSWLSCRELRYFVRFDQGRVSAVVANTRSQTCVRRNAAGICVRSRRTSSSEVAHELTIHAVPADSVVTEDLIPVEVLERALTDRWYVRGYGRDGALVAEGVMGTNGDEFTVGGRLLADHHLSRLERRVVEGNRAWVGAVLGSAALGLVSQNYTHGGDAAAKTQDVAVIGAFVAVGAAVGGFVGNVVRPGRAEWHVVWQR